MLLHFFVYRLLYLYMIFAAKDSVLWTILIFFSFSFANFAVSLFICLFLFFNFVFVCSDQKHKEFVKRYKHSFNHL